MYITNLSIIALPTYLAPAMGICQLANAQGYTRGNGHCHNRTVRHIGNICRGTLVSPAISYDIHSLPIRYLLYLSPSVLQ